MEHRKFGGTENYVYTTDDLIGKGATCEVYKGIHKVSGQIHALKIFEKRLKVVAEREIEALRSLSHENIVDFIGQQADVDSGRLVAVMEYCDKSLYTALCEPENKNGLPEEEFIRFFKHTVDGMKHLREHGFLHRDIKPGNILMVQDDNGSNIYKLSDFGTAKPVMETEAFQSLVGTEEYLHPNIFRAAFIDHGMSREFDAAADLWSLGATLYHAATGKVPFQPYQGRNNKAIMFQMIAQKKFGVIAGEQRSATGDVIWSTELPATCRMSRWLQDALTDILKRLLEGDPRRAMTFETFFTAADDILSRRIVYVFSTTSARHFKLYMKPDTVFSDVQQEINIETNIPAQDQLIYYEECLLRGIVSETAPVCSYPKMNELSPLVLIRSTAVEMCVMPDEKKFWYNEAIMDEVPAFREEVGFLDEDCRVAKNICNTIALVQIQINLACVTQQLFEKTITRTERWKEVLIAQLQTEVELYRYRIKDLLHIHAAIMKSGDKRCFTPAQGVSIEDLKCRVNSCSSYVKRIQDFVTDDSRQIFTTSCTDAHNCEKKIERLLHQAKAKKGAFDTRKRNRRVLQFHEKQLSKFDKKQMMDLYDKTATLWSSHCQKKLTQVHTHFLDWHVKFAQLQSLIEILQKEIKGLKSAIKKYMRQFQVGPQTDSMCSNLASGDSLVSMATMKTDIDMSLTTDGPVQNTTTPQSSRKTDRRGLTNTLINKLEEVKCKQEELKRMVSENDELQIQSMELMTLDDMLVAELPSV